MTTTTGAVPAAPPREGERRLAYIQGLRALAVLLVVAYHAGLPLRGGFVGVDVFFVISGFVITALLLRELSQHGRIRFWRFYARRVRRLLPALGLVLSVTAVGSMLLQSPLGAQQDTAVVGVGASVWLANAALYIVTGGYFDNSAESIPLLHMWSLAVEEQFYLVFPALLAVGYVLGRRWLRRELHGAAAVMAIVFSLSFALSLWLSYEHTLPGVGKPVTAAFYSAPTRAWEFGAGAIVAIWSSRGGHLGERMARWGAAAGGLLMLASAVLITDKTVFPGLAALLPVIGTSLIIVGGRTTGNSVARVLSWSPLVRIGDISYGWYLWHWPLIVLTGTVYPGNSLAVALAVATSFIAACGSYALVEQPIRARNSGLSGMVRILATSALLPIALFGTLYVGAGHSWGNPQLASMSAQVRPKPLGYAAGCHSSTPLPYRAVGTCIFNPQGVDGRLLLLGDSNAGQYAEAVVGAGSSLNYSVQIATMTGCPFAAINQRGEGATSCQLFVSESTAWLSKQPAATIFLAAANEAIDNPTVELWDGRSQQWTNQVEVKQELWAKGLSQTVEELKGAGHTVILVSVIPHWTHSGDDWWTPAECPMFRLKTNVGECGMSESLMQADARQSRAIQAEHRAATESDVRLFDVRPLLCPQGMCRTNLGNRWLYRDGLHISTAESRALSGAFAAEVLAADR